MNLYHETSPVDSPRDPLDRLIEAFVDQSVPLGPDEATQRRLIAAMRAMDPGIPLIEPRGRSSSWLRTTRKCSLGDGRGGFRSPHAPRSVSRQRSSSSSRCAAIGQSRPGRWAGPADCARTHRLGPEHRRAAERVAPVAADRQVPARSGKQELSGEALKAMVAAVLRDHPQLAASEPCATRSSD